jgi:preprotein translocase subunit SecD
VTGGRVVRTLSGAPERWYALGGEPAVTLDFTQEGKAAFSSLTRELARRGAERGARQHLAIVLDDRIVAVPFIDYRESPEGIDGPGALISGGLSPESVRRIAAILDSGPLPADLLPAGR